MAPRPVQLVLLLLTAVLGVTSMALGINAIVKANDQKKRIQSFAPTGVSVHINTSDVVAAGTVLTVGSGLLALICVLSLLPVVIRRAKHRISGALVLFLSVWVLASAIATLVLARTRSASVTAFLPNGTPVPDILVQAAEHAAGVSRVYWDQSYLHAATIVPFPTFALGFASAIALLTTRSERSDKF